MKTNRICSLALLLATSGFCQQPVEAGSARGTAQPTDSSVQAPVIVRSVQPQLPDEMHAPPGVHHVLISLIVDENGNPTRVLVTRNAGYGFDAKALAAVHQYKFKPAIKDGKPVKAELTIDVKFETR